MSVESTSSGFKRMSQSIRDGLGRFLPESSYEAQIILESSALAQLSFASLKNAPFVFKADEFGINDLLHSLSSRINFIEATLMGLVSLVHHVVFTVLYTAAVVLRIGLSEQVNFRCGLHWTHATYALLSSGIGLVGIVTPYYGVGANGMLFLSIWKNIKRRYDQDVYLFERQLILKIRGIFGENKAFIYNTVHQRVKDEVLYKNYYEKSLDHIEKRIYTAEKMDDLILLANDILDKWPKVGQEESGQVN